MAAKKKRVDPIKQREKRTKIAAIVGVFLLVLVAAYEVPSMLKVINKKAPPGSTYDPGPSSTPGGLPDIAGGSASTTATKNQLVDTDVPPTSGTGQLVSFSVFETKNPFTPQVSTATAATDAGATAASTVSAADKPGGADVPPVAATPAATPTTTTGPPTSVVPSALAPTTTTTTTTTTTPVAAPKPSVAIAVNGQASRVSTQGTFPRGTPVFRLVSWTKGSAQIAIVGGSYATGETTLTLHVGQAVTLQNQTDGKRYELELLSTP